MQLKIHSSVHWHSRQLPCSRNVPVRGQATQQQRSASCEAGNGIFGGLSKLLGGNKQGDQQASNDAASTSGAKPSSANDTNLFDTMMRGAADSTTNPDYPPYQTIKKSDEYLLRLYDVFPIVEMEYQRREEAYATLGGYFDGDNETSTRYKYTQPVVMRYDPNGTKRMQMLIASERGVDRGNKPAELKSPTDLPTPSSRNVRLSVSGGELVAVLQFDGYITPKAAGEARQRLIAFLKRDGLSLADDEANGLFRCAQYGAVYQLAGRLNELMLRVKA